MDFISAIKSLKSNSLYVSEPTRWKDKFEQRFYRAKYKLSDGADYNTKKVYACCFSRKSTSEAAWKGYADGKTGLASRCVQFILDYKKICDQLDIYAQSNNAKVYIGDILYKSETEINGLHTSKSPYYKKLFKPFSDDKYYSLLLLKRPAFNYEKEVRFLLVYDGDDTKSKEGDFKTIALDRADCITDIRVDDQCEAEEIEYLQKILAEQNISIEPKQFALNRISQNITIKISTEQ